MTTQPHGLALALPVLAWDTGRRGDARPAVSDERLRESARELRAVVEEWLASDPVMDGATRERLGRVLELTGRYVEG